MKNTENKKTKFEYTEKAIVNWLIDYSSYFKKTTICKLIGQRNSVTMSNVLSGDKDLPKSWIIPLLEVICSAPFSFEIGGHKLSYDDNVKAFFYTINHSTDIEEVETEGGSYFTYTMKEDRNFVDDIEGIEHFFKWVKNN